MMPIFRNSFPFYDGFAVSCRVRRNGNTRTIAQLTSRRLSENLDILGMDVISRKGLLLSTPLKHDSAARVVPGTAQEGVRQRAPSGLSARSDDLARSVAG